MDEPEYANGNTASYSNNNIAKDGNAVTPSVVAVATSMETTVDAMMSLESVDDKAIADQESEELLMKLLGKEHVDVLIIGHVDTGKSTLEEGIILEMTEGGEKQEFTKTSNMNADRSHFETDIRRYTILRPPGFKTYRPNMIIDPDVVLLVVSAIPGEFEAGYGEYGLTREHAILARDTGVCNLIVAVNKMEDPTVEWSKGRYDEIVGELSSFLKDNRYKVDTDVMFIPISGRTRANIKDRVDHESCDWYTGMSLLGCLDSVQMKGRSSQSPLRITVRETDNDPGANIVGKVEAGTAKKGMDCLVMPKAEIVKIDTILNELGQEILLAGAGVSIRFTLSNIGQVKISPGFVLCNPKYPTHAASKFKAEITILDSKNIICPGFEAHLHIHAATMEMTLSKLVHLIDKKTGRISKRPPLFLKAGQRGIVIIEMKELVCVETFANLPRMGFFTIRSEGRVVAIGKIRKVGSNDEGRSKVGVETRKNESSSVQLDPVACKDSAQGCTWDK
ncbi:translation termination factor GTPase eRF3 [Mortierella sp. AD094]|nr:translation termination factor GTPase eRF3 [Mortierella sp. AD094]